MLEALKRIQLYTEGIDFEHFEEDDKTKDAVVRNFEVIGEAAAKLPSEILAQHPDINWSSIIGFRNILIHRYFGVDYGVVWNIAQARLPELSQQLRVVLASL
ncbi:MAG TPA: DUF86 domain-containing protein [Saprospiraceae bacterium]|nr:DUF86 domain-containing protein [Saprospiraceae bacterium]